MIGITGGIGAGKSILSRILRLRGFGVYDCDSRAKVIMTGDLDLFNALLARYGGEVVDADSRSIVREKLAAIIFSDEEERLWLNSIVHAAVRNDVERWNQASPNNIFVESAILCESGLAEMCEAVWLVDADPEVRLQRAVERQLASLPQAHVSELDRTAIREKITEDIRRRISSQEKELTALTRLPIPVLRLSNNNDTSLLSQLPASPTPNPNLNMNDRYSNDSPLDKTVNRI